MAVRAAYKPSVATIKITSKRTDDTVSILGDKDKATIVVKSPFGISQAVIERQEETWPNAVVLRLHLKGLVLCCTGFRNAA